MKNFTVLLRKRVNLFSSCRNDKVLTFPFPFELFVCEKNYRVANFNYILNTKIVNIKII